MASVALPRAVRNALPDLFSNTLEVVKLTSLGSVVAGAPSAEHHLQPDAHRGGGDLDFLMLWPVVRLLSRVENLALAGR